MTTLFFLTDFFESRPCSSLQARRHTAAVLLKITNNALHKINILPRPGPSQSPLILFIVLELLAAKISACLTCPTVFHLFSNSYVSYVQKRECNYCLFLDTTPVIRDCSDTLSCPESKGRQRWTSFDETRHPVSSIMIVAAPSSTCYLPFFINYTAPTSQFGLRR